MRKPTLPALAGLLAVAFLLAVADCEGCDAGPGSGLDAADWAGRYEGTFEGTYAARTELTADRGNLVTSRFSGTAWVEVATEGDTLAVRLVDCDTTWRPDGDTATWRAGTDAEGCKLDVAGETGVVHIELEEGTARLDGDALTLRLDAEGEPARGSDVPSSLTFAFEGTR